METGRSPALVRARAALFYSLKRWERVRKTFAHTWIFCRRLPTPFFNRSSWATIDGGKDNSRQHLLWRGCVVPTWQGRHRASLASVVRLGVNDACRHL